LTSPDIHIDAERSQVHKDSSSRGAVPLVMNSTVSAEQRDLSSELCTLSPSWWKLQMLLWLISLHILTEQTASTRTAPCLTFKYFQTE